MLPATRQVFDGSMIGRALWNPTFLFWSFTWPLWLFTLVSALAGALVWFGLGVLRQHRRRTARRD